MLLLGEHGDDFGEAIRVISSCSGEYKNIANATGVNFEKLLETDSRKIWFPWNAIVSSLKNSVFFFTFISNRFTCTYISNSVEVLYMCCIRNSVLIRILLRIYINTNMYIHIHTIHIQGDLRISPRDFVSYFW